MQFTTLTDKGISRPQNEDFCDARQVGKFTLLILADGMGGANSGEVASSMTVKTIFNSLDENLMRNLSLADMPKILSDVVKRTNSAVFELSRSNDKFEGMGTTLEICVISQDTAYIAHIGDSRVYKISPDGNIKKITKDHSLVEYMIDAGTITREEAANHPQKNVITRALGTAPETEADIISFPLSEGDVILMCSDGLSNMISEETMVSVSLSEEELSSRAEKLVQLANDAGGKDNITVILAQN